ncbi:uncharacterized protein L969DRAFT_95357 [Mixia osmundae IAM 14324]|uniref:uncharacterized protein n=1 Tax=Mixia osmundae (strain CBS 9802 / IAM 14324 / JCM 22182 / KY 12970) TaxID=764103 RepID=UPI0004A54E70|nr:uncharacterized protein L969DRAFT_95357 [Mixia osmundae IAM 14324]KEI38260.1 hypothetical protein L969DRAFT_95357 [Mixia osmundae IAM 14324]
MTLLLPLRLKDQPRIGSPPMTERPLTGRASRSLRRKRRWAKFWPFLILATVAGVIFAIIKPQSVKPRLVTARRLTEDRARRLFGILPWLDRDRPFSKPNGPHPRLASAFRPINHTAIVRGKHAENGRAKRIQHHVKDLGDEYDLQQDRHLTVDECDALFPHLFDQLIESRRFWERKGGIQERYLDTTEHGMNARVIIKSNRVYLRKPFNAGAKSRTQALLAAIEEAVLSSIEPIPDVEFVINSEDRVDAATAHTPILGMSRKKQQGHVWLIPDFRFYAWPEPHVGTYPDVQDQIYALEATQQWHHKRAKLFWRGNPPLHPLRQELMTKFAKSAWAEVSPIDWKHTTNLLALAEHCHWRYLLNVEGVSTGGRLPYISQCKSVVITHQLEYADSRSPHQNIIELKRAGWQDLEPTMQDLLKHDKRSEIIAGVASLYWRKMLSPAALNCYWRRTWHEYAKVQRFSVNMTATNVTLYPIYDATGQMY